VQRLLREGGGQLSEDIPPPTAAERAESEAEKAGLGHVDPLLIPGLDLVPQAATGTRSAGIRSKPDIEAERMREVLREVLRELEAIRSLF
jgi:hypothetical protein